MKDSANAEHHVRSAAADHAAVRETMTASTGVPAPVHAGGRVRPPTTTKAVRPSQSDGGAATSGATIDRLAPVGCSRVAASVPEGRARVGRAQGASVPAVHARALLDPARRALALAMTTVGRPGVTVMRVTGGRPGATVTKVIAVRPGVAATKVTGGHRAGVRHSGRVGTRATARVRPRTAPDRLATSSMGATPSWRRCEPAARFDA